MRTCEGVAGDRGEVEARAGERAGDLGGVGGVGKKRWDDDGGARKPEDVNDLVRLRPGDDEDGDGEGSEDEAEGEAEDEDAPLVSAATDVGSGELSE